MNIWPSFSEFKRYAGEYTLIPVWTEILADLETPVTAFLKLRQGDYSFLLESVEQEERTGRYSFLGTKPGLILSTRGKQGEIVFLPSGESEKFSENEPLSRVEEIMGIYRQPGFSGLPHFAGGLVGYVSYDFVRQLERLPGTKPDHISAADTFFMLTGDLVVFDHFRRKVILIANGFVKEKGQSGQVYKSCVKRIEEMVNRLSQPLFLTETGHRRYRGEFTSNMSKNDFVEKVKKAKRYIRAGDIIQVVISQRWSKKLDVPAFNIYRSLRSVNPSPYMFYLEAGELKLIGSSPEILVRLEKGIATVRPIAGTRPRGKNEAEELTWEKELLHDEKERAEHIMLVDLGRNDLGRVCQSGSISVTELMTVEKYSHVMHLVSNVTGCLEPGKTPFSLLKATFPAGTVSGAPKIRAMEIIEELEPERRGPYAGAVGYFSFQGDMDFCITIRTFVVKGNKIYLQTGAGIVADSVPEREYIETKNKAAGLMVAYQQAGQIR
ncbi:MAG: anthranilate synthase component I [Candidatus Omnitrophica bacterium]|nr:anthranilate synthase component I [Candidatus Omnitrophota bacterium]